MHDSRRVSRRRFITLASGLALPATLTGCGRDKTHDVDSRGKSQADAITVQLADHPGLAGDGGFATLPATGPAPALLLVREGDVVRAFANICTHAACPLEPAPDEGVIYCDRDCGHGSVYSMAGDLIAGPSPRGLYEFESQVADGGESVLVRILLKAG